MHVASLRMRTDQTSDLVSSLARILFIRSLALIRRLPAKLVLRSFDLPVCRIT